MYSSSRFSAKLSPNHLRSKNTRKGELGTACSQSIDRVNRGAVRQHNFQFRIWESQSTKANEADFINEFTGSVLIDIPEETQTRQASPSSDLSKNLGSNGKLGLKSEEKNPEAQKPPINFWITGKEFRTQRNRLKNQNRIQCQNPRFLSSRSTRWKWKNWARNWRSLELSSGSFQEGAQFVV